MAWKPGQRREVVPLPYGATNDDLEFEYLYDTGRRKRGDLYDVMTAFCYRDVEQRQVRYLFPYRDQIDLEQRWSSGHDAWIRASDGAIIGQTWDILPEERERIDKIEEERFAQVSRG